MTDEQLTNRLEQLQALLDAMQEGVLLIDATATIVLLNTTATKLFGDSSAPGLGDQVDSLVSIGALGYRSDEFEALLHNLRTGRGISAQPVVFEAAGGDRSAGQKPRFVQRAETQVIATDGSLLGCLMLFRDITEERELESMRIDLSRMIVHDLRNPLTTLTTTIELLASRLRNNGMTTTQAENLSLIELVQQGALDMLDMVDSLMDMSRLESGRAVLDAEAMRFPEAARKLLVRLEPLAKQRQIALQFQFEEHLPAVWADEDMVRRVVLNLLDNALKFTPAGGQIRLEVQRESSSRADAHDGLRCSIIDNGPGIPPEAQSHIFDRFMRTNTGGAQLRGTGLGLAFCRLAIEAHGGSIWVEAEPGAGSTFVFTLPGVPR
jgi:PAS domain S-box-containing protein